MGFWFLAVGLCTGLCLLDTLTIGGPDYRHSVWALPAGKLHLVLRGEPWCQGGATNTATGGRECAPNQHRLLPLVAALTVCLSEARACTLVGTECY